MKTRLEGKVSGGSAFDFLVREQRWGLEGKLAVDFAFDSSVGGQEGALAVVDQVGMIGCKRTSFSV